MLLALFGAQLAEAHLRFERAPHPDEAGALEPAPLSTSKSEYRAWLKKAARRGTYAGVDAALKWRADAIDACVRAGGAAEASAELKLTVAPDGTARVKAGNGADPALAACVAKEFDGRQLLVPLPDDVSLTYTVTFSAVAPPASADPATPTTTADPAAPTKPGAAFAPRLDEEKGFGAVAFGTPSGSVEGVSAVSFEKETTFYQKVSDTGANWLGAPILGATYAFDGAGFYAVTVGIYGTTATWHVRESLTARYGQPRWDNRFGTYYWRGERLLLQLRPVPGSENSTITLLVMDRARASGLADAFPGDPVDPTTGDSNRRLPRIFQEK